MSELQKEFREKGYVVIRGLLSREEAKEYKDKIKALAGFNDEYMDIVYSLPDGVARLKDFWPLIFNEKLISHMRDIIGKDVRFLRHTDLHYNITLPQRFNGDWKSLSGWHRDSRFRGTYCFMNGRPVWKEDKEPFRLCRVGIYLNSTEENNAPIFVVPYSHDARYSPRNPFEKILWRIYVNILSYVMRIKTVLSLPHIRSKPKISWPVQPVECRVEPGDAVVFDARVIHAPATRIGERAACFIDYGLPNMYSYDHCNYFFKERKDMNYKSLDPELKEKLKEANLYLEGYDGNKQEPLTGRFTPYFGDPGTGKLKRIRNRIKSLLKH